MPVLTRRWNDPPAAADEGERILICRYRPRGLKKEDETWDTWRREFAPSPELLDAFHGKKSLPISWAIYRTSYLKEMRQQQQSIDELAKRVAAGETITLLCSSACVREERCHRSLLKDLIERGAARR